MSRFTSIQRIYLEGVASDHPDIKGQTEFQRKADAILAKRKQRRLEASDPRSKKARLAAEFLKNSAIKRKVNESLKTENPCWDEYKPVGVKMKNGKKVPNCVPKKAKIDEAHMTTADKKQETSLKKKYDKSGMKASMIKQYGPEKGKQVYFATIRKQAMNEEGIEVGEDYKPLPAKRMLHQAGRHKFYAGWVQGEWESNRMNKRKKAPIANEIVSDANKKADKIHDTVLSHNPEKAKSKSRYTKEDLDMLEMKLPKSSKDTVLMKLMNKLIKMKTSSEVKKTKKHINKIEKNIPRAALTASYDYSLEEAKISKTERRARNAAKKPKGSAVHAYDMDETLMGHDHSKVKVHVNDPSGKRVHSLTNQEFNTHKLPKGHSYDFGEFRSSKIFKQSAKPNKSVVKKLKKQVKQGKNVHIITARADMDNQPEFASHLRRHGIEINPQSGKRHVHVHRAGNMEGGDIGEKKVKILHGIMAKSGAKKGHMYDDAAKVHKAMEKANKEKPSGPKVKTHLVKPNKRGKVMSRSYQATKEDFELFMNTMINEGYDINQYNMKDLCTAYVTAVDEANTPKLNYQSIYSSRETDKLVEDIQLTPYEYWKTYIQPDDEGEVDITEDVTEKGQEDVILTTYDYWKTYIQNQD